MAAPYKAKIISPAHGESVSSTGVVLKFMYQAPDNLQSGAFYLRRQRLTPTVGAVQYWRGYTLNDWSETLTLVSAGLPVLFDGDVHEITLPGTWDDGIYEMWLTFRNIAAEEGPDSVKEKFLPKAPSVMAISIDDPATNGRPIVRWSSTAKQRAFQLAVFPKAIYEMAAFDITDPFWTAQATWYMEQPYVSSTLFRMEVGEDLEPGQDYYVIGKIEDQYGVDSGWQDATEFSTAFDPPPAPTIEFTPLPELGLMRLDVDAAFNLIDEASSSVDEGVGFWIATKNSHIDPSDGKMLVTGTGMTYNEMDVAHTTFDAQNTAYASFTAETLARVNEVTHAEISHLPPTPIAVVAGENYSGVFSMQTLSDGGATTMDARMVVRWYTAGDVYLSSSTPSYTTCPVGPAVLCPTGPLLAPATAAKAILEIEAVCSVGQKFIIDNIAFARSDNVAWTPGGLSVDLQFIIQRRIEDGPWEYLWSATRSNPARAVDLNYTVASLYDRAFPLATEGVEYRAIIMTPASGQEISSSIAHFTSPVMESPNWFLRCYDGSVPDMAFRAMEFSFFQTQSNDVLYVQNRRLGIVRESGDASPHSVTIKAFLFSKDEFQAAEALLNSKRILYVHRNIGDGFFIHVTGRVSYSQRRAAGVGMTTPRHLHSVDFTAEVVETPSELMA